MTFPDNELKWSMVRVEVPTVVDIKRWLCRHWQLGVGNENWRNVSQNRFIFGQFWRGKLLPTALEQMTEDSAGSIVFRIPSGWKWPIETRAKDLPGCMTGEPCRKIMRWECCVAPIQFTDFKVQQGFNIALARSIFCLCCCWPRSPSLINIHLSFNHRSLQRSLRPVRQWQWRRCDLGPSGQSLVPYQRLSQFIEQMVRCKLRVFFFKTCNK